MANTYKNAGLNLLALTSGSENYTASGSLLICPANTTIIVKACQIANTAPSEGFNVEVDVDLEKSGSIAKYTLIRSGIIPAYSSLDILSDSLVLEEGDSITLHMNGQPPSTPFTGSLSAITSYMEIT